MLRIKDGYATYAHLPQCTLFAPQILHTLCFSFFLGITAVPREIENNAYAKFWGTNKVHCGRCASGVYWPTVTWLENGRALGARMACSWGNPLFCLKLCYHFFKFKKKTSLSKTCLLEMLSELFYRYRRGQGFETRTSLNFFQAFFSQLRKLRI